MCGCGINYQLNQFTDYLNYRTIKFTCTAYYCQCFFLCEVGFCEPEPFAGFQSTGSTINCSAH